MRLNASSVGGPAIRRIEMGADQDVKRGLRATVHASQDDVMRACMKAVEVLGKYAVASAGTAKITVKIHARLVRQASKMSPTVGIGVTPGKAEGSTIVRVDIENYATRQEKFLFIPLGPKQLEGASVYKNLLKSLKQELEAIDEGRGRVELTGLP